MNVILKPTFSSDIPGKGVRGKYNVLITSPASGNVINVGSVKVLGIDDDAICMINCTYNRPSHLINPGSKYEDNHYALSSFSTKDHNIQNDDNVMIKIKQLFEEQLKHEYNKRKEVNDGFIN